RNNLSKSFYGQQLLASNDTSSSDRSPSPETSTAINTSSLIGPFKNDLEVCLYLVQHPQLIELALNMIKVGGSHESITR
ncbi:22124_t:CDS:2, partial [Gigaspora margarita]